MKSGGAYFDDLLGCSRTHAFVDDQDDNASFVFPTATGATTHLNVFTGRDLDRTDEKRCSSHAPGAHPAQFLAVELSRCGEQNGTRRHIQAHAERFRGKQSLDETFAEEDLDGFLDDRQ